MFSENLDHVLKKAKSDHLLIENLDELSTVGVRYDLYAVPADLVLYRGLPYSEALKLQAAIVLVQALRGLGLKKSAARHVLADLLSQPGRLRSSKRKLNDLIEKYRGDIYVRPSRPSLQLKLGRASDERA